MEEKVINVCNREEKVKKLKKKILLEIDKMIKDVRENMAMFLIEGEELGNWDFLITREFNLYSLRKYIEEESTFLHYQLKYGESIVIYTVNDTLLDIWLQDDYNFPFKLLSMIKEENICDISSFLNDDFFGYEFTSIFERTIYELKMRENQNKDF